MMLVLSAATRAAAKRIPFAGFIVPALPSRSYRTTETTFLGSTNNGKNDDTSNHKISRSIPSAHQKAYHLQGTSTAPAAVPPPTPADASTADEAAKNRKRRPPRTKMCGPGVTLTTVKTQHTIQTDIPKAMGGTNLAPQPVELLVAALIGCTQATAIFVGRQLNISILQMDFNLVAIRDERGALTLPIEETIDVPSRLQEITGQIIITTPKPITNEQLHLLQEQTEVRCPVANMMIASGCCMNNVEWIQQQQ